MSSSLAPSETRPGLRMHGRVDACAERLAEPSGRARAPGPGLSMHPGQCAVPSPEAEAVGDLPVAEPASGARLPDP